MSAKYIISIFIIMCLYSTVLSQYQNVRISSPGYNTPEEVSIAINPSNPLNLAAGANINFYYYSTDGGYNWTQGTLTSKYGVWGDPVLMFDANNNLYFVHLSYPASPGYWIDRIVVQKSTNGGQSWNSGVGIGFNPPTRVQDKAWIATDMTNSPYRNNLYLAWTQFDDYGSSLSTDSSRLLFSRSTDAGATWSTPVRFSDRAGDCVDEDNTVEGAVPTVGPNGEVYTSWSGPLGIMFDKSTDGGLTWGTDIFVTSQPGGWDFGISGIYRANGMPVTACDVSNSPYRGTIYVQWSDQRNGASNTDIFIIKSTDGGQTWGNVIKVNDDIGTRQQFFSWMTIDQTTGNLYVCFYDRRNTTGDATDFYVAKSSDGGETFTNFKVSSSSFTPNSGIFFGDYTNIAAYNGKVYPIWMRLDGNNLSVWTALVSDTVAAPSDTFKTTMSFNTNWNLVSLPLTPKSYLKDTLFPSAISSAFAYEGSYVLKETLSVGEGYWLKFPPSQSVQLEGRELFADTIDVRQNWNIIGSLSLPIATSSLTTIPSGILSPDVYRFTGSRYTKTDTLFPGSAYWVKTSQAGKVILSAGTPPTKKMKPTQLASVERVSISSPYTISFEVKEKSKVILKLLEREGEPIATIVDGIKELGTYRMNLEPSITQEKTLYYWLYVLPVEGNEREPEIVTGKLSLENK